MALQRYYALNRYVFSLLDRKLPPYLSYHGVHHTLDVLETSLFYAGSEQILDDHDILILKTAALIHDTGFFEQYQGHEEISCHHASQWLPDFGYTDDEVNRVNLLIRATKVPQTPQDHLSQILCDADLDYLGRKDFSYISKQLFDEFSYIGVVHNEVEWLRLQFDFLSKHHYWTGSAKQLREARKAAHLTDIEQRLHDLTPSSSS